MSLPTPPVKLEDICSVIYDNTLYVYSSKAFLKLSLTRGAEWEELQMGESVAHGVCVGSTPKDSARAGLFIVGGTASNASYHGLQKFTYSTGKWESIQLITPVTQSRRWHAATYMNSSDSILMYAGNQDGVEHASSQTFAIRASDTYEVTSYESTAPPTIVPILLPWSESEAALIGGDANNKRIMLFSKETAGWRESGATLADPIPKDGRSVKAALVSGDDGSKSLYTFDMTESPNTVNRYVLLGSNSAPQVNSASVIAGSEGKLAQRGRLEKRQLTMDQWPKYNGTLAPKSTRTGYAAAQGADGMVVFTGGNEDDVLCLFNARKNTWLDATATFGQKSLASGSPSSTSSSSASSSSKPLGIASGGQNGDWSISPNTILGIVLGSIVGLMALLGLVLFLLKRRKNRQAYVEAGHARRASGIPEDEKDTFAFANDSYSKAGHFRGHQPQDSAGSYSSMAILMGRVGQQQNKNLRRKPSNDTKRSSTSSIFNKDFKSTISKPIPQMSQHPALQAPPPDDKKLAFAANVPKGGPSRPPRSNPAGGQGNTRRSSGWNRYWSGGSALNILGYGASKRTTVESRGSSHYTDPPSHRITQDSATVPPLQLEGRPEINSVNSGSPTVSQYVSKIPLREGMSVKIERPVSEASSGYSSGIPHSVHEAWDPTMANKPWGSDRAPSSAYSGGSNNGHYHHTTLDPSSTGGRPPPTGVSKQPQLAMASTSTDMSWLNLGEYRRP